jgi:CIC family chloride channel protein
VRRLFALTLALGILSGLAAVSFHALIDLAENRLLAPAIAQPLPLRAVWLTALLVSAGLIVGALLAFVFPYARGSGIPEVKYEFATNPGPRLSTKTIVGKFLLGALSIGSGFSLGREGPTVQITAGLGAILARLTRQGPRVERSLVCVGAAAGIAAAFNTPIAAITFALEEIVGSLNQRLLGGIVVATVAAAVVEHALVGGHPVFTVPEYALRQWWELIGYSVLGVAAAVAATVFVKGVLWMRKTVRAWQGLPAWAKPGLGGALVALLGVPFPSVLGIGYATLSSALLGHLSLTTMATLSVMKLAATVVSYAWGLAGGIFAPSLYIGGMLGGALGAGIHRWVPSNPNLVGSFALVGMGAFFAGAIRAPITSIMIIFEMTGDYAIILPLMIANVISYTLAARWQATPIYDALLEQDGLHLGDHDLSAFRRVGVGRVMTHAVVTAGPEEPADVALARVTDLRVNALPVVDAAGLLVGIASRKDLQRAEAGADVASVMTSSVVTVFADQNLDVALLRMGRHAIRQLPVVERTQPKRVVGIVALKDIGPGGRSRPEPVGQTT